MKANLTRSPWRRRPSLFLGFRAPSAVADSHAVTAPVLPVRWSSTLRLDLAQHRSRPAVPSAARPSRPAPVPAQSCRYSCHCRPPAAPPRPCTQPKTSAACPARVSPSSTPSCTFVLLGVSTQPGKSNHGNRSTKKFGQNGHFEELYPSLHLHLRSNRHVATKADRAARPQIGMNLMTDIS